MGINKVVYDNQTLIDLTEDTVTADQLFEGTTAHDASGTQIIGTAKTGGFSNYQNFLSSIDATIDVPTRNTLFRGKNLGTFVTDAQFNSIYDGSFYDLFLGDYWTINDIKWRIYDFDYWYNTGTTDKILTTHHIVIMPDEALIAEMTMEDTATNENEYSGSKGRITVNNLKNDDNVIGDTFGSWNILSFQEFFPTLTLDGTNKEMIWTKAGVELPNELMIFGSSFSSKPQTINDTLEPIYMNETIDTSQLSLIRISPFYKNPNRLNYWLRDTFSANAFTFCSNSGNPSYVAANTTSIIPSVRPVFGLQKGIPPVIYAFDQDFEQENPDLSITYPGGFKNSTFQPMMTNEDNGETTAGDWGTFLSDILRNYPYLVGSDGRASYQLDPDDYTKKNDGTDSDWNKHDFDEVGFFAWINKLYMKETYSDNGSKRRVQFSTTALDGFYPVGFMDQDKNELEGVWIPMGYLEKTLKISLNTNPPSKGSSGWKCDTLIGTNSKNCYNYLGQVGGRSVFFGGAILNFLRDLEYLLFKTTNIQKVAGYGLSGLSTQSYDYSRIYNTIVNNGNVCGFKGTGLASKISNKMFHSQLLGSYGISNMLNPYLTFYKILSETDHKTYCSPYYDPIINTEKMIEVDSVLISDESKAISPVYRIGKRLKQYHPLYGSCIDLNSIYNSSLDPSDIEKYLTDGIDGYIFGGTFMFLNTYADGYHFSSGNTNYDYSYRCGPSSFYAAQGDITDTGQVNCSSPTMSIMLLPPPGYTPY